MDDLHTSFDNVRNVLIKTTDTGIYEHPVLQKWGHAWFHLHAEEEHILYLSDKELRQLHRCYGHPAPHQLKTLLDHAGHEDVKTETLERIKKVCHQCQMHSQAPRRFKFSLHDDQELNVEVFVGVLNLGGGNLMHIVDAGFGPNAARFLLSMSTEETLRALRFCWIDVYVGPLNFLTHGAGTNFESSEFRSEVKLIGITCKEVSIEAHQYIGNVERAHHLLCRPLNVISADLPTVPPDSILQMAVKAVNDIAGPDGLAPILITYGMLPRVSINSAPLRNSTDHAKTIQKATTALRTLQAERQVMSTLNARNGPNVSELLVLLIGSEVRVWREHKGWTGPWKFFIISDKKITLDTGNGPVKLRSTVCQPYYRESISSDHFHANPVTS